MGDCQSRPSEQQEVQHSISNTSPNNKKFYPFWKCEYIDKKSAPLNKERLEYDKRFVQQLMNQCNKKISRCKDKKPRIKLEILRSKSQYINRSCVTNSLIYIKLKYLQQEFQTPSVKPILPVFNQIFKIPAENFNEDEALKFYMFSYPENVLISEDKINLKEFGSEDVIERQLSRMKLVLRGQFIKDHAML